MTIRESLQKVAERIGTRRTPDLLRALEWEFDNLSQAFWLLAKHAQVVGREAVLAWAASMSSFDLAGHVLETALLPEGVQGTATIYVSSVDGDNADDGSTWALAKATVAGGLAVATDATFNFIYVDSAHSFTAGAVITWDASTSGAAHAIISVDRTTGAPPTTWLAGATEDIGASSAGFTIGNGTACKLFVWGFTIEGSPNNASGANITIAQGTNSGAFVDVKMCNCILNVNSNNASARLFLGNAGDAAKQTSFAALIDCEVGIKNVATGSVITVRDCRARISGLTLTYLGANKPASLFDFSGNVTPDLEIRDSDLSAYEKSGGYYFDVTNLEGSITIVNCKRDATPGVYTGTWKGNNASITAILFDDADTHNTFEFYNRLGTLSVSGSIYLDSGDTFDTAGVSFEVVTTSLCTEAEPFVLPPFRYWPDVTGSKTFSVEMIFDNATDLDDRTCWMDLRGVLESASFPVGTTSSSRNAQPFDGTATNLTSSSLAWTGAGGFTNSKKRKIEITRTVAEKSTNEAVLSFGVPSRTFYVNPELLVA